MGKKAMAYLIAGLIGFGVWLGVGMIGLLLAVSANEHSYRTIGAWVGMFMGAFAAASVGKTLMKKWGNGKS